MTEGEKGMYWMCEVMCMNHIGSPHLISEMTNKSIYIHVYPPCKAVDGTCRYGMCDSRGMFGPPPLCKIQVSLNFNLKLPKITPPPQTQITIAIGPHEKILDLRMMRPYILIRQWGV